MEKQVMSKNKKKSEKTTNQSGESQNQGNRKNMSAGADRQGGAQGSK